MALSLWKTVCLFLTKLKMLLPYDPTIMLLSIYSEALKPYHPCHQPTNSTSGNSGGLVAQSCPTLCDPMDCSLPDEHLRNCPGKNAGAGCHFLLPGIFPTQGLNWHLLCFLHHKQILYPLSYWGCLLKPESESEIAQLCLTLCDPMDYSLPGSTIHLYSPRDVCSSLVNNCQHLEATEMFFSRNG